ncbi:MAG: sulfatase family protein [Planctomycetota bacterium]|jgi:arylsulfatase A-like enzyme
MSLIAKLKARTLPALLLVAGLGAPAPHTLAAEKPNIIFLLTDDQSTITMGCYGNPEVKTPHLDKLSADGVTFDNHYDTTAICMASRANVMTGMYEFKTGCNFEHGNMTQSIWDKSYPVLLRKSGYLVAFAGKFGFEVMAAPGARGAKMPEGDFDFWGGAPGQSSYETAKNASMAKYAKDYPHSTLSYAAFSRDVIKDSTQAGKPFCLSISFKASHRPVTPDPSFDHVYENAVFTRPPNYGREYGLHFAEQSKQGRQYVRFEEWGYSDNYDAVMAKYQQQIYGVDVAVGRIREALKEFSAEDNTVIIFTSDNGFLCGSHGYGSKVLPYEEASRVPLIMYDPRHENSHKGIRSESLTGNIDFAPTILELAGLPVPSNMDGKSLVPIYDDPTHANHESMQLINVWGPISVHSLSVVTRDWKYIYWPYAEKGMVPTEELYHTAADPYELKNLIDDKAYGQALDFMRGEYAKALKAWQTEAVPYNNYQPYGKIFDRSIAWEDKKPTRDNKPYDPNRN